MPESSDGGAQDTPSTKGDRQVNRGDQPGLPSSNDGGTLDTGTKPDRGMGEE